jgi:hypothetical protein
LIDGRHADAETIGQSVAPYAWDQLLLKYEALITGCGASDSGIGDAETKDGLGNAAGAKSSSAVENSSAPASNGAQVAARSNEAAARVKISLVTE